MGGKQGSTPSLKDYPNRQQVVPKQAALAQRHLNWTD